MNKTVEAVARASSACKINEGGELACGELCFDCIESARAAIAAHIDAMMEPSEGMHNAARDWSLHKYGKAIGSDASDGCYRAMLTAHKKEVLG